MRELFQSQSFISTQFMISILMIEICLVCSEHHATLWTRVGEGVGEVFGLNVVSQISLNVRCERKAETTGFSTSLISSHILVKVFKLGHIPLK